jgi:hypothetical protein
VCGLEKDRAYKNEFWPRGDDTRRYHTSCYFSGISKENAKFEVIHLWKELAGLKQLLSVQGYSMAVIAKAFDDWKEEVQKFGWLVPLSYGQGPQGTIDDVPSDPFPLTWSQSLRDNMFQRGRPLNWRPGFAPMNKTKNKLNWTWLVQEAKARGKDVPKRCDGQSWSKNELATPPARKALPSKRKVSDKSEEPPSKVPKLSVAKSVPVATSTVRSPLRMVLKVVPKGGKVTKSTRLVNKTDKLDSDGQFTRKRGSTKVAAPVKPVLAEDVRLVTSVDETVLSETIDDEKEDELDYEEIEENVTEVELDDSDPTKKAREDLASMLSEATMTGNIMVEKDLSDTSRRTTTMSPTEMVKVVEETTTDFIHKSSMDEISKIGTTPETSPFV